LGTLYVLVQIGSTEWGDHILTKTYVLIAIGNAMAFKTLIRAVISRESVSLKKTIVPDVIQHF
jgi:hypothetical protein